MEEELLDPILCFGSVFEGVEVEEEEEEEDDDDDFRSCCEGDDLEEKNEPLRICNDVDVDDFSVRLYFKGVSVAPIVDSDSGLTGIGVVMKRNANSSPILVQKKLDFFVDEYVANYLALMDGVIEAKQNKIMKVFAFTDSESLCDQFNHNKCLEDSLLIALRERILEHTETLESFTLEFVSGNDPHGASELARVAVGLASFPIKNESIETCSICCEEKLSSMMITVKCNHRFCSHCMKTYVEGKLESAQVPVRCPEHLCAYCLTTSECKTFLPLNSYDNLDKALCVAKAIIPSDTIHCPHPGCSVLLDPSVCFSAGESRLECPVCRRVICVKCKVPWHTLLTCQQYRISSFEEIDVSHDTLHHVVQRRRRCQQCYSILELSSGCCHMTCCWCGYEFCCSCGAEYQDGEPSCECTCSGEDDESEYAYTDVSRTCKQWAWDLYDSNPLMMDVYSDQESSEQALINRFLAGNFSLSDEKDYESPPSRSGTDMCADVMKDLQELPWLERFVTLIDDTYNEEYL